MERSEDLRWITATQRKTKHLKRWRAPNAFMPPRDKTVLIIHETRKMVDFLAFAMQISRTRLEPVEALAIEAAIQLLN